MSDRQPWSREEVEAVTADYFAMLIAELREESYNKTAHRRALSRMLRNRSDGSIERKRQNISAVLIGLKYPYVKGYKPLLNYQRLLAEVVEDRIANDLHLRLALVADINRPVAIPTVDDILTTLVEAPTREPSRHLVRTASMRPVTRVDVDYLQLELQNRDLGRAGEELIVNFEQAALLAGGHDRLAARVEHVARTQGDGLGFDVLSFDTEGRERWLEVKTTRYGRYTPFYATRNEVEVSRRNEEQYELCRVFDFRGTPQFFRVPGAMDRSFDLDPSQYIARIA